METAMLWYDESPGALKDRVKIAAEYYADKHGKKPNLCLVHSDMLEKDELRYNGILVRSAKGVIPAHFLIGVDDTLVRGNGKKTKSPAGAKSSKRKKRTKAKPKTAAQAKIKAASKTKPKKVKASAKVKSKPKASSKGKTTGKSKAASKAKKANKPKTAARSKRKRAVLKKKKSTRVKV